MRRLIGLALIASVLFAPGTADAISRADARQVAKKALKRPLRGDLVKLQVRRKTVPRGAVVGQGGRPALRKTVKRRSWLVWLDEAPGAGFVHPSVLLLIDKKTGRITRRAGFSWWPELNGRRLFSRRARGTARPALARVARVPGFANDCIVTIGDRTDPHMVRGMAAINKLGGRHGMPVAAAKGVDSLGKTIDALAARSPACTDVMIYVAAHGYAGKGANIPLSGGDTVAESKQAQVELAYPVGGGKTKSESLGLADLRKVMRDRPQLTFKLVIDSCFSGRWAVAMAEKNLRITLTSSSASEVSYLNVPSVRRGRQKKGRLEYTGDEKGDPPPASSPAPFTAGVIKAVDMWTASDEERAKGEELGQALSYAGEHREGDIARSLGWQHGRTVDRVDERPHAGPPGPRVTVTELDDGSYRVEVRTSRPIRDGTNIQTTGDFQFVGDYSVEQCTRASNTDTRITCTDSKEQTKIAFIHRLNRKPSPGEKYGTVEVAFKNRTVELDLTVPR